MSRAARHSRPRLTLAPRMTRAGAGAAFLASGLLFAGMNTGNNLFHLLFAITFTACAVNLFAARRTLSRVVLAVRPAPRGETGRPLRIEIDAVPGTRMLPLPAIAWSVVPAEGEAGRGITPPALPGGTARGTARLVPARRGPLDLERLEMSTSFPLGLVAVRGSLSLEDVETLVWARPLRAAEPRRAAAASSATSERPGRHRGGEAVGARRHRPGDDARDIDWKATARSGRLIVRDRRGRPEPTTIVELDRTLIGASFERAVSRAAGEVLDSLARGEAVGLDAGPFSVAAGSGATQRAELLDALALASPAATPPGVSP